MTEIKVCGIKKEEDLLSLKANFENDSRVLGSSLKI